MCNCGISKWLGAGMVTAISILTIILSISALAAAFMGIFNPTLYFVGMNIQAGVMGIIGFLALLTGGIFGLCGVRKHSFKCVMVLWFCLLFISAWSWGMAVTMAGIYETLVSDSHLSVATGRFIAANAIDRVATLADSNLCVLNACPCNWTQTTVAAFTSTITGLTTSGAVISTGKTKFQDCAAPSWYSEYQRPAVMMKALESTFHCTGFNGSPTHNIYYFNDINTLIPIAGNTCNAHYDKLILANTGSVGQQFMGISISGLFFMVWLCVIGINFKVAAKPSQSSPGMIQMA